MTEDQTKRSSESAPEGHVHEVYTDHVAVPEVRTGKVDLEGDFHKDQAPCRNTTRENALNGILIVKRSTSTSTTGYWQI